MKKTAALLLILIFGILSAQSKEHQFRFDVKKFRKEWTKSKHEKSSLQLKIFDPNGSPLIFNIMESSISEQPIQNINTFKGSSMDGTKRISFTLTKKTISGSYSDQGVEVYFDPVINKKSLYKVYIPNSVQTGQEKDFVP
ncbi:hypothetical protein ACM46_22100 [Chryseobacterium angstadtii]|uniref:Uncharacterized protein n=1 Tax=Chryseobacterium angstadtii TaxID=558151 RepID=A0A0J7HYE4_9FLAO|nr:hypothetical protein [Chryseobacterium angstadtii]KMQ58714.1 hypothetical protein ACM46_22100 [Chryseobacterium angstadtii]